MPRTATSRITRRTLAVCLAAALVPVRSAWTAENGWHRVRAPLSGDSLFVTNCADDGGPETLRAAVAAAASGDTVDLTALTCSTITLIEGQIDVHVDDLAIAGP